MSEPSSFHYVFVCQGKNCLGKGSRELLNQLRETLADHEAFRVVPYICFGACAASPNVAVFPDRLWYSTVAEDDVASLVQSILKGEELPDLSGQVSADLKNLVFRLFGKPFRV
jgi:sirohydrochlorin cobaltochelatase